MRNCRVDVVVLMGGVLTVLTARVSMRSEMAGDGTTNFLPSGITTSRCTRVAYMPGRRSPWEEVTMGGGHHGGRSSWEEVTMGGGHHGGRSPWEEVTMGGHHGGRSPWGEVTMGGGHHGHNRSSIKRL